MTERIVAVGDVVLTIAEHLGLRIADEDGVIRVERPVPTAKLPAVLAIAEHLGLRIADEDGVIRVEQPVPDAKLPTKVLEQPSAGSLEDALDSYILKVGEDRVIRAVLPAEVLQQEVNDRLNQLEGRVARLESDGLNDALKEAIKQDIQPGISRAVQRAFHDATREAIGNLPDPAPTETGDEQ